MDKRILLMFVIGLCATSSDPAEGLSPDQGNVSAPDPADSRTHPTEMPIDPAAAVHSLYWGFEYP